MEAEQDYQDGNIPVRESSELEKAIDHMYWWENGGVKIQLEAAKVYALIAIAKEITAIRRKIEEE